MNRLLGISAAAVAMTAGLTVAAGPAGAATYSSCSQAAAAGKTNIPRSSPDYSRNLDRDNDGIACESGGGATGNSGSSSSSGSAGSNGSSGSITVNSGSGGQADRTSSAVPVAVGGLGILVLGGSAVAVRRRASARL